MVACLCYAMFCLTTDSLDLVRWFFLYCLLLLGFYGLLPMPGLGVSSPSLRCSASSC